MGVSLGRDFRLSTAHGPKPGGSEQEGVGYSAACTFLFDNSADGVQEPQLAFFTKKVLVALSLADPKGRTCSRLQVGLPMLPAMAERMTAVRGQERSGGHTISHDVNTYKFLIWDWLDSLTTVWSTVDPNKGFEIFRRHTGECVTLTTLDRAIGLQVHRTLAATPGYVGAFEIDPGNPLHREAFSDRLIHAASIMDGAVFQELSFEGDPDWPTEGAEAFKPGGLIWKPYGWLQENGPPELATVHISARGVRFLEAFSQKHAGTVEHRVLEAILHDRSLTSPNRAFSFEAVGKSDDILQAVMPEGKFTKYIFDHQHKDGAPKGKFFTETIGIEPDDWRFLAAQFYDGLLLSKPENLELRDWGSGYGMRFNAAMRVQGRTGTTAAVKTGWMMRPGALPSLASAMPADRDLELIQPPSPPILEPGVWTDKDWALLYCWAEAAGVLALSTTVPTPMFLHGFSPIAEGEMGFGVVRVPDARRGFARWLIRNSLAERHAYGGAMLFSPSSTASLDRGVAWAHAFVKVLTMNGLTAEVESRAS